MTNDICDKNEVEIEVKSGTSQNRLSTWEITGLCLEFYIAVVISFFFVCLVFYSIYSNSLECHNSSDPFIFQIILVLFPVIMYNIARKLEEYNFYSWIRIFNDNELRENLDSQNFFERFTAYFYGSLIGITSAFFLFIHGYIGMNYILRIIVILSLKFISALVYMLIHEKQKKKSWFPVLLKIEYGIIIIIHIIYNVKIINIQ